MKGIEFNEIDGSKLRIGVVVANWNRSVTENLEQGVLDGLKKNSVLDENITILRVPGSFELLYGAASLQDHVDAVVCLGVLIKGETMHFEYIAEAVSNGIAQMNVKGTTPVIFGVLTCLNEEQAIVRATGENNHGYGWGMSAVEMALLKRN